MRILLNFLPVYRGGGLQNALNFWRTVREAGGEHTWLAVARPGLGLEELARAPWQELRLADADGLARRLWLQNVWVPEMARAFRADVLFCPMGVGPVRTPLPTVIGWHDSTAAYPRSPLWRRAGARYRAVEALRLRYARAAARRASRICVQTRTMARRLSREWGIPEVRFRVIPNGPSAFLGDGAPAPEVPAGGVRRILVVGEPKPAKNLEVVPAVAAVLRDRGVQGVELQVTMPAEKAEFTGPFDREEVRLGPGLPLRRIGRIRHQELGVRYRESAAVFLPSLAESFSATYVEAMQFGVPLVTSDLDFAREICGDAALYVDPLDAAACAGALIRVLEDRALRRQLREAGFRRVRTLPDWTARFEMYLDVCREALREARP